MIDTIKLNITDCSIDAKTQLVIEPSPYLHDSQQRFINYDLFVDSDGECVQGKKAYMNKEKFNVTIKPKYSLHHDAINKKTITAKYIDGLKTNEIKKVEIPSEDFNSGIYVQTSLPRYMSNTNFQSISISDEKKVLKQLEKDLWNEGIKTSIWNSNLSRVDIFANLNTSENFLAYSNIFNVLNLSRMDRFEYAGTTFLYRNGEQQICCYDKIFEMNNKIKDLKFHQRVPNNVMRIENRLLKKRKIFSVSGISQLYGLYRNYDFVKQNYRDEVGGTLFKHEPEEIEIMIGKNIIDEMKILRELKTKGWFNRYFRALGLKYVLSMVSVGEIEQAFEDMDLSKMQLSRAKRDLRKAKLDIELLKPFSQDKNNLNLYRELKTKFYKAVA